MTLDEAIEHAKDVAKTKHDKDYRQLAKWLKELKKYKDKEFANIVDRMSMKSKKWTFKIRYYVSDNDADDVYFEEKNDVVEEYAPT